MASKYEGSVLVTGCGGLLGLSVGKILHRCNYFENTVGLDITNTHAGRVMFSQLEIIPPIEDPDYVDVMRELVEKYRPRLIIPCSESELRNYGELGLDDDTFGVPILMANQKTRQLCLDKYNTIQFLRNSNIITPWTLLVGRDKPLTIPCLLKARKRSKDVKATVIGHQDLVDYYHKNGNYYIWQEILYPKEEEYSCGVFRSESGEIRTIILKRKTPGTPSTAGVLVQNDQITRLIRDVAQRLELVGSINIQLNLTSRGPIIFKIHPHFSSTVVVRHHLGFKDLLWSIQDKLQVPLSPYKIRNPGTEFYRPFDEIIL